MFSTFKRKLLHGLLFAALVLTPMGAFAMGGETYVEDTTPRVEQAQFRFGVYYGNPYYYRPYYYRPYYYGYYYRPYSYGYYSRPYYYWGR